MGVNDFGGPVNRLVNDFLNHLNVQFTSETYPVILHLPIPLAIKYYIVELQLMLSRPLVYQCKYTGIGLYVYLYTRISCEYPQSAYICKTVTGWVTGANLVGLIS